MLVSLIIASVAGWFAVNEMHSSQYQAEYFSHIGRGLAYKVDKGSSPAIRFPKVGPYDERLGYTKIPDYTKLLSAHD
ncbi:MAG TPA: hypothetical protein VNW52_10135, partial [Burkholderiaceae bacterium]|nr:hypothetical protein [Burkholderiaceae bacterium]